MSIIDGPLVETVRPEGIRCGQCKGTHPTVADIRACFGARPADPASEAQRNYAQLLFREREPTEEYAGLTSDRLNVLSRSEAGKFISVMKQQPHRRKPHGEVGRMLESRYGGIEEGYYALRAADGTVDFWKVVDGRHTRMLYQVFGSPGALTQNQVNRIEVATRVLEGIAADPKAAMLLFGTELKVCGACGSPLTNEVSREVGIGPTCRGNRGW